jgi:hypothetical protein
LVTGSSQLSRTSDYISPITKPKPKFANQYNKDCRGRVELHSHYILLYVLLHNLCKQEENPGIICYPVSDKK